MVIGRREGSVACSFDESFLRAPDSVRRGEVFVGAFSTICSISFGTLAGVTPSMIVKAGKSSTVVGLSFTSEASITGSSGGVGIFDALSISFCVFISQFGILICQKKM